MAIRTSLLRVLAPRRIASAERGNSDQSGKEVDQLIVGLALFRRALSATTRPRSSPRTIRWRPAPGRARICTVTWPGPIRSQEGFATDGRTLN